MTHHQQDLLDRFTPSEVIAALGPLLDPGRARTLDQVAAGRLDAVVAVLEDLRDPHNAGAALRSCEAMGVRHVEVISTRHYFRTATRVTQGSEKWLELGRWSDVEACVRSLRARGIKLYAAVPPDVVGPDGRPPVPLGELDPREPKALAFGNEHTGLSPRLRALADGAFTIPMHGFSQSLNVSVSVAVSLHVATEARRRALGRMGDLDGAALERLRARYYALDVRGAEAIVERHVTARRVAGPSTAG